MKRDIENTVIENSQIDPSFKTQRCYVNVTAAYIVKELVLKKGYALKSFCKKTIDNVLNRIGYTLKKVLKIKPLKKIPQTDAIFENVKLQHERAEKNDRILRISIDTKAKVKIGNLSRGGYARSLEAPQANDHDQNWDAVLVPLGIYELNTDNVFITFGNSSETSDFIVDGLEKWWSERTFMADSYDSLMIDLDNGKAAAGNTKQFIVRIAAFAKKINMPIQLVYYPPYHSKYNAVERVWAALENYWRPMILDTVDNTLNIARKMTWKGMNPIVSFIDKVYPTGIAVADEVFNELEHFTKRNPVLKNWDILIFNNLQR